MRVFGSFDGPDGCGKSTLLAGVTEYLARNDVQVHAAPALGDFLPAGGSADAFRDWILHSDGLDVAAALIGAAARRLEAVLETERTGDHILLADRGSLTVRLSAISHGSGDNERPEHEVLTALAGPLQELAALDKKIENLVPCRTIVILPHLGMATIERRLNEDEVVSDRYLRYLTVLHDHFRSADMSGNYVITAEEELRINVNLAGELLLKATTLTGTCGAAANSSATRSRAHSQAASLWRPGLARSVSPAGDELQRPAAVPGELDERADRGSGRRRADDDVQDQACPSRPGES